MINRLKKLFCNIFRSNKPARRPFFGEVGAWNKDAAALLNQFLDTTSGKVFLAQVALHRPSLGGISAEETALKAKVAEGYEMAITRILSLAEPPDEQGPAPDEAYPPLDDDTRWTENNTKKE